MGPPAAGALRVAFARRLQRAAGSRLARCSASPPRSRGVRVASLRRRLRTLVDPLALSAVADATVPPVGTIVMVVVAACGPSSVTWATKVAAVPGSGPDNVALEVESTQPVHVCRRQVWQGR